MNVCVWEKLTCVRAQASCCWCWPASGFSPLMDPVVCFSDDAAKEVDPDPHTTRTATLHKHTLNGSYYLVLSLRPLSSSLKNTLIKLVIKIWVWAENLKRTLIPRDISHLSISIIFQTISLNINTSLEGWKSPPKKLTKFHYKSVVQVHRQLNAHLI